jgi:hypothetical protein
MTRASIFIAHYCFCPVGSYLLKLLPKECPGICTTQKA